MAGGPLANRDRQLAAIDLELWGHEMGEHGFVCESGRCERVGREHAADWWARSPCGHIDQVCEVERVRARHHGGLDCLGCGFRHGHALISWIPIRVK